MSEFGVHPRRHARRERIFYTTLTILGACTILGGIAALAFWGGYEAIRSAKAHGAADWIQENPAYLTPQGSHCCGPSDCERAPDDAVTETAPGRWFVPSTGQSFRQGEKGVYPAIRPGFWWCRRGGKVVCLFFDGGAA